jgi:hypothetical protein
MVGKCLGVKGSQVQILSSRHGEQGRYSIIGYRPCRFYQPEQCLVGLDRNACEDRFAITVWLTEWILTATVTATVGNRADRRRTLLSPTAARGD